MGLLKGIKNTIGAVTGTNQKRRLGNAAAAASAERQAAEQYANEQLQPFENAAAGSFQRLASGVAPGGEFSQGYQSGFDPNQFAFQQGSGLDALNPNIHANLPDAAFNVNRRAVNPNRFAFTPQNDLPQAGFNAPVQAFSSNRFDFTADPGYRFRLNQGSAAIERSAAARGKGLSGQTLKALAQYGQNLASEEFGRARDRALQENQLAYDRALSENRLGFDRGLTLSDRRFDRGLTANQLNYDRARQFNDTNYNRALTANNTAFDRGLQLDAIRRATAADNFNRGLSLNAQGFDQRLRANQLNYDRAFANDARLEDRFYRDDALRYNRLAGLAGQQLGLVNDRVARRTGFAGQNASQALSVANAKNAEAAAGMGRIAQLAGAVAGGVAGLGSAGTAGGASMGGSTVLSTNAPAASGGFLSGLSRFANGALAANRPQR